MTLWEELCADPKFQDFPYKIETDRFGRVIMSPARNEHGYWQGVIVHRFHTLLPEGRVIVECGVETNDGVKVADVAWFTRERFVTVRLPSACSIAPQIAVEILSDSNTRREIEKKRALYFERGAEEFWLCDDTGVLTFFTPAGLAERSVCCPEFPVWLD